MSTALFRQLAAVARQAVERVHGDAILIVAMDMPASPNGRASPSATIAPFEWTWTFYQDADAARLDVMPRRIGNGASPAAQGGETIAVIREHPEHGFPKSGWLVKVLPDGPWYALNARDPDGLGHVRYTVAAATEPSLT